MSQVSTVSVNSSRPHAAAPPVLAPLLPIIAVVFIAFLVIGLAMSVFPQRLWTLRHKQSSSYSESDPCGSVLQIAAVVHGPATDR